MNFNKTLILVGTLVLTATQLIACDIFDDSDALNQNDVEQTNNASVHFDPIQSDWAIPSQLVSDDDDSQDETSDQLEDITSYLVIHLGEDSQFITLKADKQFNPECYLEKGIYSTNGNEITFNEGTDNESTAIFTIASQGQNVWLTLDIQGEDPFTMTLLEIQLSDTQLNSIEECTSEDL